MSEIAGEINSEMIKEVKSNRAWRLECEQLRAEINEHARLFGISAKKELALRAENEKLKAELAEAKKDAERLKGLRELCGYVEDGSSQTVTIAQDDATKDWIIRWNDRAGWVFSTSFKGVIDEAMKGK